MSSHSNEGAQAPLDLRRWRNVPNWMIGLGGLGVLIGLVVPSWHREFAFSWLLAFMFFLSLSLGGLFLVIVHHLFDAGWSVPMRRLNEHLACLAPVLAVLFLPIAFFAPRLPIYEWMKLDPHLDHALHAKQPLFTVPMFYVVAALCFGGWTFFAFKLRGWSLRQDKTGAAECTFRMRRYAALGIFVFAITLTLAAIMWMKALQHQWFSTMYGVYYFAGSVWLTVATIYILTVVLKRQGYLRPEIFHEHQYYFLGSLLFAFTVFYAYIHFSQYFIIWNANVPEETFWYVVREEGTWWYVGQIIIFGHFFVPFLALLRIDLKLRTWWMGWLFVWAVLMHFTDLAFNIKPVVHPHGFALQWLWLDLACWAFIGGVLVKVFLKYLHSHPYFPVNDPRLIEAMGEYAIASQISGGELGEVDDGEQRAESATTATKGGAQ